MHLITVLRLEYTGTLTLWPCARAHSPETLCSFSIPASHWAGTPFPEPQVLAIWNLAADHLESRQHGESLLARSGCC